MELNLLYLALLSHGGGRFSLTDTPPSHPPTMRSPRQILLPSVIALLALLGSTDIQAKTYNVAKLGAIPDDGVDDSRSIEAAMAKALPGDVVYFPAGDYHLTRTIHLKSGVKLNGVYGSSQLLWIGPHDQWMIGVVGTAVSLLTDASVQNLVLNGQNTPMAGGIGAIDAERILIKGNHILNFAETASLATHGVHFIANVLNSTISDNTLSNIAFTSHWGTAVRWSWGSHNIQVINNAASNAGRGGFLCNDDCTGSVIRNNSFTSANFAALGIELWRGCHGALVEYNRVDHWISVGNANFTAVRHNVIQTPAGGDYKFTGIEVGDENNYVIMTGNDIGYGQMIGLSVSGKGTRHFVYVAENVFEGASTWAAQFDANVEAGNSHWYLYRNTFRNTLPAGNPHAWDVAAYWNDVGHGLRFFAHNFGMTFDSNLVQSNPGSAVQSIYGTNSRITFKNNTFDTNGLLYSPIWGAESELLQHSWGANEILNTPAPGLPLEVNRYQNEPADLAVLEATAITAAGALKRGSLNTFSVTLPPGLHEDAVAGVLWDFGEGLPEAGMTVTRSYSKIGNKTVTALVFLHSGTSARKTLTFTINR